MAEEEKKPEKKIIVDEDWKQKAQKEKEILEETGVVVVGQVDDK